MVAPTPAVTTTLPVCATGTRQCPDGRFVGRNPYRNCEFYECPTELDKTPPVITDFEISPAKVPVKSEVRINCNARDEKALDRSEIVIYTPSGRTDIFASVGGRGYFADQEGVYTVSCKARDRSGNANERTQTFFVFSGPAAGAKQACPGECCAFENDYEDKFCASGLRCENRACKKIEYGEQPPTEEIAGVTTVRQILDAPGRFENKVVKVVGNIVTSSCAEGSSGSGGGGFGSPAPKVVNTATARDIVTGRATAVAQAQRPIEAGKCFPFQIDDGTGRIGLVGFGGSTAGQKIELKGVVRTYEFGGGIVPFLKVEGRSDFQERREEPAQFAQPMPFYTGSEGGNQECFKVVRKYAIRLAHNKDVKNVIKEDRDELWNYLDQNHQDTVSKLTETCRDEPEIVTDYLSRAVENEISKSINYGFEGGVGQQSVQPTGSFEGGRTGAPPANVVPIVVVTRDVSNAQIEELRAASGVSFGGPLPVEAINRLTVIRMPAHRDNIEKIRGLPFVEDVKVDSVNLVVHGEDVNEAFETRSLGRYEIPKDDILKKLEVIKSLAVKDDDQILLSSGQDSIIQSTSSLEDFENLTKQRGVGYTFGWLLGAAAEQEKKDAAFLGEQVAQLEDIITTLETVASGTDDITIKANLGEQVDILKKQVEGLKKESETKNKNAGGILALIRNLFGG